MMRLGARVFLACALFFAPFPAQSVDSNSYQDTAIQKKLWKHPYWIKILHYHKKSFGGYESKAAANDFFLSTHGRENPKDELLKNIELLLGNTSYENPNDHPACKFPLRYRWLREQLSLNASIPQPDCPEMKTWLNALGANGVSLVFASSYTNNPASMFGHTFLRLHRIKDGQKLPDLLHYTINFAAETGVEKGMLYTVKGLFGFYPGYFSTFPFYIKIQQYNNVEARDLWEYDLNIKDDELEKIVFHLWEMGSAFFAYYFVDENCSYYLLALLESANPQVQLLKHLPFFTTPVDTMKIVSKHSDWISAPHYRPSLQKRFEASYSGLDSTEQKAFDDLIKTQDTKKVKSMPEQSRVDILDSSMDYLSMKEKQNAKTDFQKKILAARSETNLSSTPNHIEKPADPLTSHPTMRIGPGFSRIAGENWAQLDFRGAYHDLLDNPDGFDPSAQIQSLDGRIRFSTERKKVTLDHLKLIEVISLNPLQKYLSKPSWNIGFGWRTHFSDECFNCGALYVEGGPGFTLGGDHHRRLYFTMFANMFFQAGPWNHTDYQVGPSALSMLNFDVSKHLRFAISGTTHYSPFGSPNFNYQGNAEGVFEFTHSLSLRGWYKLFSESHEYGGTLLYYF